MRAVSLCFIGLCILIATLPALAEPAVNVGGLRVSGSGNKRGQIAIATRSDVTLSLESGAATNEEKLQQIGQAANQAMNKIRKCYSDQVMKQPDLVGELTIHFALPLSRKHRVVEITKDELKNKAVIKCTENALKHVPVHVKRPAAAVIRLKYGNTAARGVQQMRKKQDAFDEAGIDKNEAGQFVAYAETNTKNVQVTVTGLDASKEEVSALRVAIRAKLGKLLDCRRRAGSRSGDPSGVSLLSVTGKAKQGLVKMQSSNVGKARDQKCILTAIKEARRSEAGASGQHEVKIVFTK